MAITGCRNDALTILLNGLGYQPLVLAKTGLKAPFVYSYKDTKLEPIGPLSDYLVAGTVQPENGIGSVPEIARKETDNKSGSAIASFLGDALKVVGITSAPKLDTSLSHGTDFVFSFDDVTSEGLTYSKTAKLLRSIDKDALSDLPPGALENGYIQIAYEFLYAGALSMRAASGTSASFDAKAIQVNGLIDVGASGILEATSGTSLSFKAASAQRAAFACKIGWLEKVDDSLHLHIHEDAGEGFLADEGGPQPYLLERGVVIRAEGA
jgi:hypothetical protein